MNSTEATQGSSNVMVFILMGFINLLAILDYKGILDYSVKTILGGLIWMGFKILSEYLSLRLKRGEGKKG